MLQTCILQNEDLIVTSIVLATIKTAADSIWGNSYGTAVL